MALDGDHPLGELGHALDHEALDLAIVPIGGMCMYGGAAAPNASWLLCDGTSYLRATYPDLFAAIGTAYGSVDGTHFTVPNFTQRLPLGKNGATNPLGQTGGSYGHQHSTVSAGTPAGSVGTSSSGSAAITSNGIHQHALAGGQETTANFAGGSHTHSDPQGSSTGPPSGNADAVIGGNTEIVATHTHTDNGHTHTSGAFTGSALGTHGHGTDNPPFLVVNYLIRAL